MIDIIFGLDIIPNIRWQRDLGLVHFDNKLLSFIKIHYSKFLIYTWLSEKKVNLIKYKKLDW